MDFSLLATTIQSRLLAVKKLPRSAASGNYNPLNHQDTKNTKYESNNLTFFFVCFVPSWFNSVSI